MFVQLPNGATVEMSTEEYLSIPDDQFDEYLWKLVEKRRGAEINNPFTAAFSARDLKEELLDCEECHDIEDIDLEIAKTAFEEELEEFLDEED